MSPSNLAISLVKYSVDGKVHKFSIRWIHPFSQNKCGFLCLLLKSSLQLSVNQRYFPFIQIVICMLEAPGSFYHIHSTKLKMK